MPGADPQTQKYLWVDETTGHVQAPVHYDFPNLGVILQPSRPRTIFLKLVRASIMNLL